MSIAGVGIIAALPREIAGLVKGCAPDRVLKGRGVFLYRVGDAVVVAAGMGATRAAMAVEAAMATGGVTVLVSAGLAGGCGVRAAAGSVMEAAVVVDARTGERFEAVAGGAGVTLATMDAIASVREKARLEATYGAQLVDMEAATVARLARAHGVGFRAIKGVSDGFDFELEGLGRFAGKDGGFRTGAFAMYTAVRPWLWGKAIRLGRDSAVAVKGLERELRAVMESR